ncbi:HepT-like ribonuclease domain-containing protein [Spirosoma fluminis]
MCPLQINFLQHIQAELNFIVQQSVDVSYEDFLNHPLLSKAFIRSFEIIGEACKNVSDQFRSNNPEFDWRGFTGMHDKLIHNYWGIDYQLMWDAIRNEVPANKEWIDIIIKQELNKP